MKDKKIKSFDDFTKCEISFKNTKKGIEVVCKGHRIAILAGISTLISWLLDNTSLTKEELKMAIDDGLKSQEEIREEIIKKIKKLTAETAKKK